MGASMEKINPYLERLDELATAAQPSSEGASLQELLSSYQPPQTYSPAVQQEAQKQVSAALAPERPAPVQARPGFMSKLRDFVSSPVGQQAAMSLIDVMSAPRPPIPRPVFGLKPEQVNAQQALRQEAYRTEVQKHEAGMQRMEAAAEAERQRQHDWALNAARMKEAREVQRLALARGINVETAEGQREAYKLRFQALLQKEMQDEGFRQDMAKTMLGMTGDMMNTVLGAELRKAGAGDQVGLLKAQTKLAYMTTIENVYQAALESSYGNADVAKKAALDYTAATAPIVGFTDKETEALTARFNAPAMEPGAGGGGGGGQFPLKVTLSNGTTMEMMFPSEEARSRYTAQRRGKGGAAQQEPTSQVGTSSPVSSFGKFDRFGKLMPTIKDELIPAAKDLFNEMKEYPTGPGGYLTDKVFP